MSTGEARPAAARAARPQRDRADRARVVSDAVVALDVRRRARQAELALAGGVRPGDGEPRRLPRHLALRRRLARDEPRRDAAVPPARRRPHAARPALRGDGGGRAPRLHARGARLERGRDQALRGDGLRRPRRAARLLHGQPGGRADHVARPGRGGARREPKPDDPRASRRPATRPRRRSSPRTARSARTSSPRRRSCTRGSAASSPRSRRAATSSSSRRSSRRRSARRGRASTTSTRSRSRRGRG